MRGIASGCCGKLLQIQRVYAIQVVPTYILLGGFDNWQAPSVAEECTLTNAADSESLHPLSNGLSLRRAVNGLTLSASTGQFN